jgi:hypothetical protein
MSPNLAKAGPSRVYAKNFKTPTMVSTPKATSGFAPLRTTVDSPDPHTETPVKAVVKPFRSGDLDKYKAKVVEPPRADLEKIHVGVKSNPDRAAWRGAVHDPNAKDAVVMPRPPEIWAEKRWVHINRCDSLQGNIHSRCCH